MPSDLYVASFNNGPTHGIRPGWRYDAMSEARTWCGIPGSFGIQHMNSGAHIPISCGNCAKAGNRFRVLSIEVHMTRYHVLSNEVETWRTDAHWEHSESLEWDADAREEYPDPVEWAIAILGNAHITQTPLFAGFPDLYPSHSPLGDAVEPYAGISGTAGDNYTDEETEWMVRLPSAWTTQERAEVFRRATNTR